MSTSLKEQLERLKVPQTSALLDRTKRASILFDVKEAANKDRRTIYELGISGLQELIALNGDFKQFESTLFDEASLDFVRAVENTAVNNLLDRNIKKFLQHLSPYFLLRPAHLCIEWLLRRFEVHAYNRDELLALALPYHETNVFIRVLQTVRIREIDGGWKWLRPLQNPGVPLPKSVIINRAAANAEFLRFVVSTTLSILREFGPRAHLLQAQINFHTTVVVGTLQAITEFKEWHISTLMESLLYALNSKVVDVAASGYVIASQLVARTQLKTKLCSALLDRVIAVSFEELRPAAVMLVILIFDIQETAPTYFSEKALNIILGQKWLIPIIAGLVKQNVEVFPLCSTLLRHSVNAIQSGREDEETFKRLALQLLNDLDLPQNTACRMISCFLDCFVYEAPAKLRDGDVIDLDSDEDEMPTTKTAFSAWYSDYLRKLEHKYPEAFDLTIKEALSSKDNGTYNRKMALKIAVGYRLKISNENTMDVYESLYHHNAQLRHLAMQTLLKNLNNYQTRFQNMELLKACLADRLLDDSRLVVGELLKLPEKEFIDILGYEKYATGLLNIFQKIQTLGEGWSKLAPPLVKHLTSSYLLNSYDANLILLALMPLLFPSDHSNMPVSAIEEILKSDLVKKFPFLKRMPTASSQNPSTIRMRFLSIFDDEDNTKGLPVPKELFASVEKQGMSYFKHAAQISNFLILLSVSIRETQNASESLQMFDYIETLTKKFQIKQKNNLEKAEWENVISLRLYTDCLLRIVRYTKFDKLSQWSTAITTDHIELVCFLRFFEHISNNTVSSLKGEEKEIWSNTMVKFFDLIFPDTQTKVDFLTNFYVNTDLTGTNHCTAVERLIAFKVLNSILNCNLSYNLNLVHILKIGNALVSQHESIRTVALETLTFINKKCEQLDENLKFLVEGIMGQSYEIAMDKEQYPLVLYLMLSSSKKRSDQLKSNKIVLEILKLFNKSNISDGDIVFTAQLLDIFKHFNDEKTITAIIPLAMSALENSVSEQSMGPKMLPAPYSQILLSIIHRFQVHNIENVLQDCSSAWKLFEKIFEQYNVYISVEEREVLPIPCVFLNIFDGRIYESLSAKNRFKLIKLILRTEALAQNDTISLAAYKLLKHCVIDCKPLIEVLHQMYSFIDKPTMGTPKKNNLEKRGSIESKKSHAQTNTLVWKEGVALLELLENKEKLLNAEQLIPTLFELLKHCLELDEQAVVEYTKQLILSTLLHCCRSAQSNNINLDQAFSKTIFRIDRIVQCLRATQNPQTHQNALTLLAHCAAYFPVQVLHNVVDIFTFMGSSVVRKDDAFSFHIIDNIIVSIIPILVQADQKSDVNNAVIPVLKVFADIMLDVPEHRRISLYSNLMNTLGAETHFWRFLCIVFETQVADEEKRRLLQRKNVQGSSTTTSIASDNVDKTTNRIDFIMTLSNAFEPKVILETCTQLLIYLKNTLPLSKELESSTDVEMAGTPSKPQSKLLTVKSSNEAELFDLNHHSEKQLRHYKYSIMQYLSSVSKAPELLRKVALLNDSDLLEMKPYFQNFIISILAYVPTANLILERCDEPLQIKFWKIILHHLHDALDNAISLLSPDMFLIVIIGLMQHKMLTVRKKVIELLITKMHSQEEEDRKFLTSCDEHRFHDLIKPLSNIIDGILTKSQEDEVPPASPSSSSSNEMILLQQTALIAVKLLSKHFALKYITEFKTFLANLTKIVKCRANISKIVLATVVLALIEISSNLKAHSLEQLPKFMPQLIELLQQQAELVRQQTPDHVSIAIITGFQKLFESLPRFLGPYIVDIITALSLISTRIAKQQNKKEQRSTIALGKISTIWTKIASEVYVRILVPSCEKSYKNLIDAECYDEVAVLMKLLCECIVRASNEDLAPVQDELRIFFMSTLEFRLKMKQKSCVDEIRVTEIESTIIDAFVAYVLKLSESAFRPLYENIYDMAIKRIAKPETQLTYFILSSRIGEALKSLFLIFAGTFLEDAANLLEACNTLKSSISAENETICIELVKAILSTLHNVFLYASKNFMSVHRFEMLMPKIVDQLENRLTLENESIQQLLTDCIAQLAIVVSSDIMWKQLNYQVLLKTRTNVPEVRILSFNCCVEIARKLGEEFTSLLPETVPFIAELFEDENSRVEKNTRKSVQELEIILGESLQKYL